MIILSVGMPRAGSGWHYNLIHDLMQTTGCVDAREIRARFHLEKILTEVNCNIGVLSARRLAMVSIPALLGNTFVIKAHSGPTSASTLLSTIGLLRITYIYRDPHDAMLSAFNYGQRALGKGHPNAFSHLTDFQTSVAFITDYIRIWEKWVRQKKVLVCRYEDLLTSYEAESAHLINHLGLDGGDPKIQEVLNHYRPEKTEGQHGTHFFMGKIGRFRDEYSREQQDLMADQFGLCLAKMGYAV